MNPEILCKLRLRLSALEALDRVVDQIGMRRIQSLASDAQPIEEIDLVPRLPLLGNPTRPDVRAELRRVAHLAQVVECSLLDDRLVEPDHEPSDVPRNLYPSTAGASGTRMLPQSSSGRSASRRLAKRLLSAPKRSMAVSI